MFSLFATIKRVPWKKGVILALVVLMLASPVEAHAEDFHWGFALSIGGGAAWGGCALGQALVPIPVLGCALGALVGGAAGFITGNYLGDRIYSGLIDAFTTIVGFLAQVAVGIFLNFAAALLTLSIQVNSQPISHFQPVVDANAITTDIANMLLIALFIIIALATIVNIESFGMRRVLPMLVIMALVVNFSTIFVGMFIDAGNTVMNFFWTNTHFSSTDLVGYIQNEMKVSATQNIDSATLGALLRGTSAQGTEKTVTSLSKAGVQFLVIMLGGLAAYIFLRFGILFLLRISIFYILIITAPLVFILGALPKFRGQLQEWLRTLLNWAFIGPISFFLLYIGLLIWHQLNESFLAQGNAATKGDTTSILLFFSFPVVAFFFMQALSISKKMAGAAANAIVDSAVSVIKGATLGTAALAGGAAIAGIGRAAIGSERMDKITKRLKQSNFSGIRNVGQRLEQAQKGVRDSEEKDIKATQEAFNDLAQTSSDTNLQATFRKTGNVSARLALVRAMVEKGRTLSPEMINYTLRYGASYTPDTVKKVKEFYPTYDDKIYQDPKNKTAGIKFDEVFKKFKDAKDPKNIHYEDFASVANPGGLANTKDSAFVMLATQLDKGDKNKIASDPSLFAKYSKQIDEINNYSDPEKNLLFQETAKNTGFSEDYIRKTFENLALWNTNAAKWRSGSNKGGGGGPTPPGPTIP